MSALPASLEPLRRLASGAPVVAVHRHPALPLAPSYLVAQLVPLWREAGLRVVVVSGSAPVAGARVGVLHVDLTRVSEDYLALAHVYPALLNGAVADIGKRRIPDLRVTQDDAYAGPVIVKTDLNHRGFPERIARRRTLGPVGRLTETALDWLRPSRPNGPLWHRPYPVFPKKTAVPRWVWTRPDLVVDRFVPETLGGQYVQRHWLFLGDEELHLTRYATTPIPEPGTSTLSEQAPTLPQELRALRTVWGLDFGKLDYVLHDGRPVLLDVNKTPSYTFGRALPRLAAGLARWLGGAAGRSP